MPTKRTPINRPLRRQFSARAIELFKAMAEQTCTCKPRDQKGILPPQCRGCVRWWDLHSALIGELPGLPPWQWPAIRHPDARDAKPEAVELYRALAAAAGLEVEVA